MPSSIFSSSESAVREERLRPTATGHRNGLRAVAVLLGLCVLFLAALEAGTRSMRARITQTERRTEEEYQAALALRRRQSPKTLLVFCNSLLGTGVEFDSLRKALAPEWDAHRYFVEATVYYDWHYGMRRLLSRGVRVDVFAVALTARQLTETRIVRSDYFAYRLLNPSDVAAAARDLSLDRTSTANMFFASLSDFYGLRGEIRKVVLGHFMPDVKRLTGRLVANPKQPPPLSDGQVYHVALQRLRAFRELARAANAEFILIVPPLPNAEGVAAVERAAEAAHVAAVVSPSTFPPDDFKDGFHLNQAGARKYTAALIPELRRVLHCRQGAVNLMGPSQKGATLSAAAD